MSVGALLAAALAAAALATPAHADTPPGSTAPSGYQLVFSDDFNGTSLDTTTWGTRQSSAVSDDNVSVSDGNLRLDQTRVSTAQDSSGYRGSGVATKTHYGYGYYEARVKLPPNGWGWHPAFWGQIWDGQYAKPDYNTSFTELDFFEAFSPTTTNGGYLTWNSDEEDRQMYASSRVDLGAHSPSTYRTYGALYGKDSIQFYVDGVLKGTLTYPSTPPNSPMSIWLSTIPMVPGSIDSTKPVGYSYGTMDVDWVRYYTSAGTVPVTVPASVPASLTSYSNDFESGSAANWTTTGGSWSVTSDGSSQVYRNTSTSGDVFSLYTATPAHFPRWRNTTVSATLKLSGTGGGAGLLARYTDAGNYYYLRLTPSTNSIDLVKRHNGVVTTLASHATTISPATPYQLSLKVNDTRLTAKLNGTQIIDVTDRTLTSGKWGVKSYYQSFSTDSVTMTSP
ncbi:family 16 glycosylhydrolase [Streptomyces sp. NPDC008343]|uniref:glycoside hydrolase family 16 protein n=1 Tax=Streptomyces sp. NPDC008343 TaxID=3364828 RepID=UPI0036E0A91D